MEAGASLISNENFAQSSDYDGAASSETDIYRNRARRIGLPFTSNPQLGPDTYSDTELIARGRFAMSADSNGPAYMAPENDKLAEIRHWLALYPKARLRLQVTTPTALRQALREAGKAGYAREAVSRMERINPSASSRQVVTTGQIQAAVMLTLVLTAAATLAPATTTAVIGLAASLIFLSLSLLRFYAAGQVPRRLAGWNRVSPAVERPIYTVLVPILHEAHLIEQIVGGLTRLDWPKDCLDIKLIVEHDDLLTQAAAVRAANGPPFEIIIVPPDGPRTKPKALQYAMTFARGSFVTIYDAEDQPHPLQLEEAFAVFSRADEDLACLQAPLVIANGRTNALTALFTIEYANHFDGLLPALARLGLPLPLGGTSNHFKRACLDEVGGWDPYNVTEDAEIAIRLARAGFRTGTITLPTFEEAPTGLKVWLKQRTRWSKGWMQTWLAHMRAPHQLFRDIGPAQALGFNLLSFGMMVAALAHPIFLATPIFLIGAAWFPPSYDQLLLGLFAGLSLFNLMAGYIAVVVLWRRTKVLRAGRPSSWALIGLPAYWLLMSLASFRAIWQLAVKPFYWEKTPHLGLQRTLTNRSAPGKRPNARAPLARFSDQSAPRPSRVLRSSDPVPQGHRPELRRRHSDWRDHG